MRALVLLSLVVLTTSCLSLSNRYRNTAATKTAADLAYIEDGDDKHRLDIFAPSDAQGAPVVIFIHGGYFRDGDRHYYEPIVGLYGNVGVALSDMGVVAVVPSYRLFPKVNSVYEQLDDVAAVVRFVRDHIAVHGGDPNKIVIAGHSAGGHLATYLATAPDALSSRGLDPSVIKGIVGISGVYDINAAAAHATQKENVATLWDPLFGEAEAKRKASPLQFFGTVPHAPLMLMIGENDYPNCARDYENAVKQLDEVKGSKNLVFIAGNTHEDMVLEIGTKDDEVGPPLAAFARFVTGSI